MTEAQMARHWRETNRLTREELSALTGYSAEAVYLFESGRNSKGEPHAKPNWQRYKLTCLAVATLLHYKVASVDDWAWS